MDEAYKESTHRARKIVLLGAALTGAAELALTAAQPKQTPRPEVRTDVSYQKLGELGPNKPSVTLLQPHEQAVTGVNNVNSNNPYERAQDFLFLTQYEKNVKKTVAIDRIIVLRSGTYTHTLKGDPIFWPEHPSNNGDADALSIKPGQVGVLRDPVYVDVGTATNLNEEVQIPFTLATGTNSVNTANDVKKVYFVSAPKAEVYGQAYLPEGSPGQVVEAIVNSQGNFVADGQDNSKAINSQLEIMPKSSLASFLSKNNLNITTPIAGR